MESVQKHKEAKEELFEVLAQKEVFWKQRSKQFWLNSGDRNSWVGVRFAKGDA